MALTNKESKGKTCLVEVPGETKGMSLGFAHGLL